MRIESRCMAMSMLAGLMLLAVPVAALAERAVIIRDDGCGMVDQSGVVTVLSESNIRVGTFSRNCNSTVQCKATGVTNTTGKAVHHDFDTTGLRCWTGFGYTTEWHQIISKSGVAHLVCHINTCQPPECGDEIIIAPETCDDGNTTSADGCSDTCTIEEGYDCTGTPSVCVPDCGDGLVVGAEECDDGGTANGDGCSDTCTEESGYDCTGAPSLCAPVCGDGQIVGSEGCDDGNTTSCDGCSSTCVTEECGDNVQECDEECDDGNTTSCDGCSSTCVTEECGNNVLECGEQCDDGNTTSCDDCSSTCEIEECGNNVLECGEVCDDGNTYDFDSCNSDCSGPGLD